MWYYQVGWNFSIWIENGFKKNSILYCGPIIECESRSWLSSTSIILSEAYQMWLSSGERCGDWWILCENTQKCLAKKIYVSTGYYKFMKKDLSNCQKEIENRTKYLPFGHIVMAQEAAATWG